VSKSNRILIALFLAQIILIMGMTLSRDDTKATRVTKVFEAFDPAKVTRVKILGEPKDASDANQPTQPSIELAKEGTQWVIVAADNYPADGTKVQELLDKIGKLKARGDVLTKATYHKKLEVADDKYQRLVTLTHDGKELKFYLGTSPSFKSIHLRKAGSNEVLQASELTSWEVGTRAWDWVDRTYVKYPEKDLWSVRVQNKQGGFDLDKSADGSWSAKGVSGPLKKTVVDDMTRKVATINLEEPVGKNEKPEYGLSDPLATITIVTGTSTIAGKMPDEMKTDVVRVGAKLDKDNRYYVKASTSPYVVQVATWGLEPLVTKGPKDLIEEPKKDEPKKAGAPAKKAEAAAKAKGKGKGKGKK
jgi:hypothetical protein